MTSHRKRKREAQSLGLVPAELQLTELLREVLDLLRWHQVLGYGNQYLLQQKLQVTDAERRAVTEAAAAAVARDGRLQDWDRRLAAVEQQLRAIHARLGSSAGAGEAADGG